MKALTNRMITGAVAIGAILSMNPVAAETATPGKYKIDPAHTTILFSVNHLGVSTLTGRFDTFKGEFNLAPKGKSSLDMSIDTKSVDTNHAKRDDHLRSPDFFNVKQYPKMQFVSDNVTFDEQGEPVKIVGKLSLHGKNKPVTLAVTPVGAGKDPWGGYRAGYAATTTIKRSDYGMNFMQGGIGDKIQITLNIEAIKQ